MIIPKQLKIGGRIVKINRKLSSDMQGDLGFYSDWTGQITIANDLDVDPTQQNVTIIHEVIEFLDKKHQYKLEHDIIQSLSENLYQVLKDNKLVFK